MAIVPSPLNIVGDEDEMPEEDEKVKHLAIEFESSEEFLSSDGAKTGSPVTIYRLVKLEHAEALGIPLQQGSITTPNDSTKIITRSIIKLRKPPKNLVLAQKNTNPPSQSAPFIDRHDESYYEPYILEDADACSTVKRYSCKLCNKGFRHISHLKRHINSHIGDRQFQCEACNKSFVDASTLCRHRKTHTGERPFECKICSKCFGTLGSLRRHMTVHNQESRPYCCNVCSKRFPDNSSFQKHNLIHTGIKKFQCNVCSKAFVHIGDLNGHKKVHEISKPWKCDRCDKQFSKQSNCIRHAQIHEGDKDFVCNICGVGYNFQSSLTRHLLTHRQRDNVKKNVHQKVVIFRKIQRQRKRQTEPHKLMLDHIKGLFVHKKKLGFVGDQGEIEVTEVSNDPLDVSHDEEANVEEIVEEEDIGNEDADNEEHMEIALDEEEEYGSEDPLANKMSDGSTVIIKQISADGEYEYIIEEALN